MVRALILALRPVIRRVTRLRKLITGLATNDSELFLVDLSRGDLSLERGVCGIVHSLRVIRTLPLSKR